MQEKLQKVEQTTNEKQRDRTARENEIFRLVLKKIIGNFNSGYYHRISSLQLVFNKILA